MDVSDSPDPLRLRRRRPAPELRSAQGLLLRTLLVEPGPSATGTGSSSDDAQKSYQSPIVSDILRMTARGATEYRQNSQQVVEELSSKVQNLKGAVEERDRLVDQLREQVRILKDNLRASESASGRRAPAAAAANAAAVSPGGSSISTPNLLSPVPAGSLLVRGLPASPAQQFDNESHEMGSAAHQESSDPAAEPTSGSCGTSSELGDGPAHRPRRSRQSTGVERFAPRDFRDAVRPRHPDQKGRAERRSKQLGATAVRCEYLPIIFNKIISSIGDAALFVMPTRVHHLIVENAMDTDSFPEGSEQKLFEYCLEQIEANLGHYSHHSGFHGMARSLDFSNLEASTEMNRKNGLLTEPDIAEAIARYDKVMNSPEMVQKRSYRIESHTWTEEELERFEMALSKFPNSPVANQQIAEFIGNGIHANQVVYLKSQYRLAKQQRLDSALQQIYSDTASVPYDSYDYSTLASSKNADLRGVVKRKARVSTQGELRKIVTPSERAKGKQDARAKGASRAVQQAQGKTSLVN